MAPIRDKDSEFTRRKFSLCCGAACLAAPYVSANGRWIEVEHAWGTLRLNQPAERVVSIGYTTQDALLAMGVVPLAVRHWFGENPNSIWPWALKSLGQTEPVAITGEVSIEMIADLAPDLIVAIGSGIARAEYEILVQIAPVLMHASDEPVFGSSWQADTRRIGRALGKDRHAEKLVSDVEAKFLSARSRHPDWKGATAVAAWQNGSVTGAFLGQDKRAQFLTELGFVPPKKLRDVTARQGFYATLSPEDLSPLDADLLLWTSSLGGSSDIARLPMRRTLHAHRQGREVFADTDVSAALSFGSVLSLPFALDRLEADFSAALDGRPGTIVASAASAGLTP